jgi:hypothetical protein
MRRNGGGLMQDSPIKGYQTGDAEVNYAPPLEDSIKCSSEWEEKKAKRAEWQANKRRYRSKINY